jgi:hypothetical protein
LATLAECAPLPKRFRAKRAVGFDAWVDAGSREENASKPKRFAIFGGHILSQIDPTDHALAAIASIMDQSESPHEPEAASPPEMSAQVLAEAPVPPPLPAAVIDETPLAPAAVEADGYSKIGPGPMAAIRFKWTVRRGDEDHFYVDETIGENSAPIVTGPMSADNAVRMVDTAESEARQRFEQLRSEMTGRAAAAGLVRNDNGEA